MHPEASIAAVVPDLRAAQGREPAVRSFDLRSRFAGRLYRQITGRERTAPDALVVDRDETVDRRTAGPLLPAAAAAGLRQFLAGALPADLCFPVEVAPGSVRARPLRLPPGASGVDGPEFSAAFDDPPALDDLAAVFAYEHPEWGGAVRPAGDDGLVLASRAAAVAFTGWWLRQAAFDPTAVAAFRAQVANEADGEA